MTYVFDVNTPSPVLTEDILRKVNALGHEPRVIVELDKLSYVPGMKNKFHVWDRIRTSNMEFIETPQVTTPPAGDEPSGTVKGGESGERFEYIKCSFYKKVKEWKLPDEAYLFFLAVAKHETGFGTLGKGRPEKGSFIVGYGCPGSCNPTYSGIDTQTHYACKRFNDAMKSRYSAIKGRGYLTADDINYFHQGGDKGYNKWVWSADGANWKKRVKQYYDGIRREATSSKWQCKSANSTTQANATPLPNTFPEKEYDPTCVPCNEQEEVYTVEQQRLEIYNSTNQTSGATFPIEGINFSSGAKVSSHHMKHPGGRSGHKGIDIVHNTKGKIEGMWVVAAFDGKVEKAYKSSSYGNCVMLKHPNGYGTVYAHMQDGSLQVRAGQPIKAGTRLGRVGNTGRSYGAHLHFEIWKGGWVYGGTAHLDPYPILTGAQGVSANSGGGEEAAPVPSMEVTTNYKFNKCFDKDGKLDNNWVDKQNIKHFTAIQTGEKYIGFSGNVAKGDVKGFGYKHNFSADGYYEYAYFCDLKEGDSVKVSLDGVTIHQYTKDNNTSKPSDEKPIYIQFLGSDNTAALNSHILDFTVNNVSGNAVFGIKCFKVAEVDVANGASSVNTLLTARKGSVWLETGAFVYDTTFYLEDDITNWEVNTHYDMRVATARFTLDNKHGMYSPSYERNVIFPDNLRESEMSYYEGGTIRHVLSESTPVRIYAGYGDNLVRVFTGKIKGEIEENSSDRTVTISCVDMYDTLEEHVFDIDLSYPNKDEITGHETTPPPMWVKSAIVHNIVNESGLIGWRVHREDLEYADVQIEETYYIDIDRGGKKAVVWDAKQQRYVEKNIATVKDANGYKNPFVQSIDFAAGTRAADAIQQLIEDIMYRAYCNRYGTFVLQNTRNITENNHKWEFIDGENLMSLTTSIDHSRVRDHLMISGSQGFVEHFVDRELFVALKGDMRTASVSAPWIDESYGATARGMKEEVANKLFFDMKTQARTFNVVVKGNPLIEVLDGAYVYDQNTSNAGYFIIKGNRLTGNKDGMVNQLELTWQELDYEKQKSVMSSSPIMYEGAEPQDPPLNGGGGGITPTPGISDKRQAVLDFARKYIGRLKYMWGVKSIDKYKGGDCSGFSYHVFKKAVGVDLGHGTMTQVRKGTFVPLGQEKPGDLVFFKGTIQKRGPNAVSHVGIVTRPGYCISLAGSGCKEHGYLKSTDTRNYWHKHFMQLRRVLP